MIRTLNTIQDEDGLEIRVISTDRHNQIKKLTLLAPGGGGGGGVNLARGNLKFLYLFNALC